MLNSDIDSIASWEQEMGHSPVTTNEIKQFKKKKTSIYLIHILLQVMTKSVYKMIFNV